MLRSHPHHSLQSSRATSPVLGPLKGLTLVSAQPSRAGSPVQLAPVTGGRWEGELPGIGSIGREGGWSRAGSVGEEEGERERGV